MTPEPTDHVARNREIWDRWSPEWVDAGRRAWGAGRGMWEIPEADVRAVPAVGAKHDAYGPGRGPGREA